MGTLPLFQLQSEHITTLPVVNIYRPTLRIWNVRREKVLDFSGCKSRPGTGSLHPVAIEAVVEATKLLKPSMEKDRMATQRACRP
jgi:hypothetical protein